MSYLTFQDGGPQIGGAAFQSLTDALDPAPIVIPLQHFVEWFSGDALDTIWTSVLSGSGSVAMSDTVNGGLLLDSGASGSSRAQIWFNSIDHYSETGSTLITVTTFNDTADLNSWSGLGATIGSINYALMRSVTSTTNFELLTKAGGGSATSTESSIARDTSEHKWELNLRASSALEFIDDVLEIVTTAALPVSSVEPQYRCSNQAAASKTVNTRYLEAFNT